MAGRWRTALCLAVVAMLITTPIGYAATPTGGHSEPVYTAEDSLTYRQSAGAAIVQSSLPDETKDEYYETLQGTTDAYVGPNRVNRSIFETDKRLAAKTRGRAPNVTRLLLRSDKKLAHTAVDDAARVADQLERRNVSYDRAAVAAHLDAARAALDRGDKQAKQLAPGAIVQYGKAWTHAREALAIMDAATTPEVTITKRQDLPHPNETISYPVTGTVQTVDSTDLTNATLVVNGEARHISLNTSVKPGANATFYERVNLSQEINEITVRVTDPARNDTEQDDGNAKGSHRGKGKDGKQKGNDGKQGEQKGKNGKKGGNGPPDDAPDRGPPGDDGDANATAQVGSDTLKLDGDGLTDRYELRVTETDPLDPDSNSSRTAVDESDNGIRDGAEDYDNDTIGTYYERQFGTEPFDADTDGDGLEDGFEIRTKGINATAVDTDDDGTPDPEEDLDGDGLNNSREAALGTGPRTPDSDFDGLNDSAEVDLGTDPLAADSDDDGLRDGEETGLPTDPLDPDTDDDGVLDGNETFTTDASDEDLGVSLSLTGEGDVADGVTIERESAEYLTTDRVRNATASSIVHLESEREFEQATVTIEYDESAFEGNASESLAMFTYNASKQMYVPLDSTVDAENGTVSATTSHFSTFVVFNVKNWASIWSAEKPDGRVGDNESSGLTPLDVTFVIDSSGSMGGNDPRGFRKRAAKRFVGALVPDVDRAAVVDFDSFAFVRQGLTTDYAAVNRSIERLGASGGTDIGDGLATANSHFASTSNDSRAKIAILLTDGQGSGGRAQARTAADRNITIYTIGFGNANRNKLRDIAQITGGEFNYVADAEDLPEVFSRVANETAKVQDTDGDGLSDAMERDGFQLGVTQADAEFVTTDPGDPDTDGDGVSDGQEVGKRETVTVTVTSGVTYNATYYKIAADPTEVDTDGDGLDDFAELRGGHTVAVTTSPEDTRQLQQSPPSEMGQYLEQYEVSSSAIRADTDGDGLDDLAERQNRTDPTKADSDGDGIPDGREVEVGADPTMFDASAPDITVYGASHYKKSFSGKTNYRVRYTVEDPSGVRRTAVKKGGTVRNSETYGDLPTYEFRDVSFTTNFWETSLDAISGATVYVISEDRHGNERKQVGYERANFYGELAGELDAENIFLATVAGPLGTISGFSASLGATFDALRQLVQTLLSDPLQFLDQLEQLVQVLRNVRPALVERLVNAAIQNFQNKMQRNNPYDQGTDLYGVYKNAWYLGYAAGFVAKAVVGAGLAKALKSTQKFQRLVSLIRSNKVGDLLFRVKGLADAAQARVASAIVRKLEVPLSPVLRAADSAGVTYRLYQLQRQYELELERFSESARTKVGRILRRSGDDGAETIDEMPDDAVDDMLRCTVSPSSASLSAAGGATTATPPGCNIPGDGTLDDDDWDDIDYSEFYPNSKLSEDNREFLAKFAVKNDVKTTQRFGLTTYVENPRRLNRLSDDGDFQLRGERDGVDIDARYYVDSEREFERKYLDDDERLEDGTVYGTNKGDLGEDIAAKELVGPDGRYEPVSWFDKDSSSQKGVDLIAKDPESGQYVFIEVKYSESGGSLSKYDLGRARYADDDEDNPVRQMSDTWLKESLNRYVEIPDSADISKQALKDDIDAGLVKKEVVYIKDGEYDAKTATQSLTGLGGTNSDFGGAIDRVTVIQTGDLIQRFARSSVIRDVSFDPGTPEVNTDYSARSQEVIRDGRITVTSPGLAAGESRGSSALRAPARPRGAAR